MKRRVFAAAFAAACVLTPGGALSQTTTVAERVTLQQWGQRVGDELNRRMRYPRPMSGQSAATGVVKVKFNCSDSGRPDKVALLRSSGSRVLDQAALSAVQRIATLHPLPDGMRHDQQYQAVLLFESDQDRYDAMLKTIRSDATKTNGWFKDKVIAGTTVGPIAVAAR